MVDGVSLRVCELREVERAEDKKGKRWSKNETDEDGEGEYRASTLPFFGGEGKLRPTRDADSPTPRSFYFTSFSFFIDFNFGKLLEWSISI